LPLNERDRASGLLNWGKLLLGKLVFGRTLAF
jgi:hypothetical protein